MQTAVDELESKGKAARNAGRTLAKLSTTVKDRALFNIADALGSQQDRILAANEKDCDAGRQGGLTEAVLDRLLLDAQRLEGIAADVRDIAALPDPVGETLDMRTMPNGMQVGKVRVAQRHRGHLGPVPQVGQRRDLAGRQGGHPLQLGPGRAHH